MGDRKTSNVILFSCITAALSMGVRQSFGLFLQPISEDLSLGREVFSLAMAWQNLLFGLPLLGIVSDRFGPRWVIAGGGLLYAMGFFTLSAAENSTELYLILGPVVGLALSSISYVVLLGAVAQVVPAEKRGSAFGIVTASSSVGTFVLAPGLQWLINSFGWRSSLQMIGVVTCMIVFFAFGFPGKPDKKQSEISEPEEAPFADVLIKASKHSGYLLLNVGFFVCGFHVAFIGTHLPSFLTDQGLPKMVSATALSLIGLFNIFGSYFFGRLGDRYRKKYLLSFLYTARAAVFSMFILIPVTEFSALVFGGFIGFLWLATVPLTSGTIAQIFGSRYLSTLYGIVFLSHQIGSFLGVWLAGRVYDSTGSYDTIWMAAIALALGSAVVHLPIADRPIQEVPQRKAATVSS